MTRFAYYGIVTPEDEAEAEAMQDNLTTIEEGQLVKLEAIIEHGLQTFVEVGNALAKIRDSRLYRIEYDTFEDYCQERWAMARRTAYQYIEAAQVVENVRNCAQILPTNEAQTRPLAPLTSEQRQVAWEEAVNTAPNGKVTGAHVQRVVDNLMSQELQVLLSHKEIEWYTPPEYIEAARQVMGAIGLDPATDPIPQEWIRATIFYTTLDDGLIQPWQGRVWLNPPYSTTSGQSNQEIWALKLIKEYQAGQVTEAILLVKASLGYNWFDRLFDAYPVCFKRGLISFINSDRESGPAKLGSAFFYLGPNLARFASVFSQFGRVIAPESVTCDY